MNEIYRNPEFNQQAELIAELQRPQPTVIGIEGGPCGGKTTLVNLIEAQKGERQVIVLPEAATQHIERLTAEGIDVGGLAKNDREGWLAFEADVLQTIVEQIDQAKEQYAGTDAIIIADRCDIGAYVEEWEYGMIQHELGFGGPPMLELVDKLYYLPSVATVKPELYEGLKATNPARYETLEQAQETCDANLSAVAMHPELHIGWSDNFEHDIAKMARSVLHPEEENEEKLRPVHPESVDRLLEQGDILAVTEIKQSYHSIDGQVYRLRETITDRGGILLHFAIKTGEGRFRTELQRTLTYNQYDLLKAVPYVGGELVKTRYSVLLPSISGKRMWSIDRYYDHRVPKWNLETDVDSDAEADSLYLELMGEYQKSTTSAQQLAKLIVSKTLS